MKDLELEIKEMIINVLDLEDVSPDDIVTEDALFDGGLGLDSIDALELGIALQQRFGVRIDAEDEGTREHFRSVRKLAMFVAENRTPEDEAMA